METVKQLEVFQEHIGNRFPYQCHSFISEIRTSH